MLGQLFEIKISLAFPYLKVLRVFLYPVIEKYYKCGKINLPILNFPDLTTKASLAVIFESAVRAVVAAGLAFELIKMGSTYREYRSSYPLINKIVKAYSNWSVFTNLSNHL